MNSYYRRTLAAASLLATLPAWILAESDGNPGGDPECCSPPASAPAAYETALPYNSSNQGYFSPPDLPEDTCILWTESPTLAPNKCVFTIQATPASDPDPCINPQGHWLPWTLYADPIVHTWNTLLPGGVLPQDPATYWATVPLPAPIDECKVYQLKLTATEAGGDCLRTDPNSVREDLQTIRVIALVREMALEYEIKVDCPFYTYAGKTYNGGTKVKQSTTVRIQPPITSDGATVANGGNIYPCTQYYSTVLQALDHCKNNVWRTGTTHIVNPTTSYSSFTPTGTNPTCNWCVTGGSGTIDCQATPNGDNVSISYARNAGTGSISVTFHAVVTDPCNGAPVVAGEITFEVKADVCVPYGDHCPEYYYRFSGWRDGFAKHKLTMNGMTIYENNPCTGGGTPGSSTWTIQDSGWIHW